MDKNTHSPHPNSLLIKERGARGSAVVYIVLMMFLMMTSAAIVLSSVLTRHIRAAQDYISSERAFAAANTGLERMLYDVARATGSETKTVQDYIDYGGSPAEHADYAAKGKLTGYGSPCIVSSGTYRDVVRRVTMGEGATDCDTSAL